ANRGFAPWCFARPCRTRPKVELARASLGFSRVGTTVELRSTSTTMESFARPLRGARGGRGFGGNRDRVEHAVHHVFGRDAFDFGLWPHEQPVRQHGARRPFDVVRRGELARV